MPQECCSKDERGQVHAVTAHGKHVCPSMAPRHLKFPGASLHDSSWQAERASSQCCRYNKGGCRREVTTWNSNSHSPQNLLKGALGA